MISTENVENMKKKITRILVCILIVVCVWNVSARVFNQTGEMDSEYKEINANARAQRSDGQSVTLEDVLPETEASMQSGGSDIGLKNENIAVNSGNLSDQNEKNDEKMDADEKIETEQANQRSESTDDNDGADSLITDDKTAADENTEDPCEYETGYIFLGDSRFYLMNEECKIEDVPNFFVVSCPGMGYAWLADTAFPKVQSLQRQHTEIKNWVVICGLGVNDLTSIRSYLNKYRKWPASSKLYLLSVNPTKSGAPARCNNQRIEAFNSRLKKVENATYIDCYRYLTKLGYGTKGDGIHYDSSTNWAVYSYVLEQLNRNTGGEPVTESDCKERAKKLEDQLSQKNY